MRACGSTLETSWRHAVMPASKLCRQQRYVSFLIPRVDTTGPSSHPGFISSVYGVVKPCGMPYNSSSSFALPSRSVGSVWSCVAETLSQSRASELLFPTLLPSAFNGGASTVCSVCSGMEQGVVLAACPVSNVEKEEVALLRNAARLGAVRCRYHVLCRLPSSLACDIYSCEAHPNTFTELNAVSKAALLNPYVSRYCLQRVDGSLSSASRSVDSLSVKSSSVRALCEKEVVDGLIDIRKAALRREGTIRCCVMPADTELPDAVRRTAAAGTRVKKLFLSAPPASQGKQTDPPSHPWISSRDVLKVSPVQVSQRCGQRSSSLSSLATFSKSVELQFRLLTVSPFSTVRTALYEVETDAAVTPEDVRCVFANCGFHVVNDFIHNLTLAGSIHQVKSEMVRRFCTGGSQTEGLPLKTVHWWTSTATPVELVLSPLALCGRRWEELLSGDGSQPDASGKLVAQKILRDVLRDNATLRSALLPFTIGVGVECVAVTYPDVNDGGTRAALQQTISRRLLGSGADQWRALGEQPEQLLSHLSMKTVGLSSTAASALEMKMVRVPSLDGVLQSRQERGGAASSTASVWCSQAHASFLKPDDETEKLPALNSSSHNVPEAAEFCVYCALHGKRGPLANHLWKNCPDDPANKVPTSASPPVNQEYHLPQQHIVIPSHSEVARQLAGKGAGSERRPGDVIPLATAVPKREVPRRMVERTQRRIPRLHRSRSLRCTYCFARHHISVCPELKGGQGTDSRHSPATLLTDTRITG